MSNGDIVGEIISYLDNSFPFLSVPLVGAEPERIAAEMGKRVEALNKEDGEDQRTIHLFNLMDWPTMHALSGPGSKISPPKKEEDDPFGDGGGLDESAPIQMLEWARLRALEVGVEGNNLHPFTIVAMHCHDFADAGGNYPLTRFFCQALRNALMPLKSNACSIVFLGPSTPKNPSIDRLITELECPLPRASELAERAESIRALREYAPEDPDVAERVGRAAAGLTRFEAENVFALESENNEHFDLAAIQKHTRQIVQQVPGLVYYAPTERDLKLDDIVGLDALKAYLVAALTKKVNPRARAKGIIMCGPPGTGKSAVFKALAVFTGRPVLVWSIRQSYGSLLGETERNVAMVFRIAEATGAILAVDEGGADLSGGESSGRTDGGVTAGVIGFIQSKLQDMEEVFTIFNCNDLSTLPGPLRRSGRFDKTFWVGFPTAEELVTMFVDVWGPFYDLDIDKKGIKKALQGKALWAGADVEAACREAAREQRSITDVIASFSPSATTMPELIAKFEKAAIGVINATTGKVVEWTESGDVGVLSDTGMAGVLDDSRKLKKGRNDSSLNNN